MGVKSFRTMQLNDCGADVLKVQQLLAKNGSTIAQNGYYTIGMVSAVKAFQRRNGLAETGKIDKETWEKLNPVKAKLAEPVRRTAKPKAKTGKAGK